MNDSVMSVTDKMGRADSRQTSIVLASFVCLVLSGEPLPRRRSRLHGLPLETPAT